MATNYVYSLDGICKEVCAASCCRDICGRAHPNAAGSQVKHPKWCLNGAIHGCTSPDCAFNHFRTEAHFVKYRANDTRWAANHKKLVAKYKNVQGYFPAIEEGQADLVLGGIVYYNTHLRGNFPPLGKNK